ncbi:MAG: hypothetical protein KIG88_05170 [Weeksellaceae bacterium]|nr:hypothetical protein [Weeksellaceae bacterium]
MNKFLGLLFLLFSAYSCTSAKKHNAHMNREISVDELHKDIEFAKKKILTKHVDVDWYYSKNEISNKIDSFRKSVNSPMKPNDFSREFSRVVASLGHGHTHITSLGRRFEKEEKKKYKNSKGPIGLLQFKSLDNRLILEKSFSKDTTIAINSEVLAVNTINYQDFYNQYKDFRKGDGYITTFQKHYYGRYFSNYLSRELAPQDSLVLTLKKNDSIFTQIVKREYTKKDKNVKYAVKKDSVETEKKVEPNKKLTKEEKLIAIQKAKHKREVNKSFAFQKLTKSYLRELEFPVKNDSTIAVLKIKSFTAGYHKKAYKFIFDSIQKHNVQHLILDIRNNGGGYPTDINHLYSFLTTRDEPQMVITNDVKVNSKTAKAALNFRNPNIISHTLFLPFFIGNSINDFFRTHKKDDAYYYRVNSKKQMLNENNKYRGNLYVLTNGMSYSASSIIAASLQNEGKAIFVGEETGGDYNGTVAGVTDFYKLPNSKIKLGIGMMTFTPNTSRELKGRGVIPNVPIDITFDDLLQQKDPQLEWILNNIEAGNK